MRKITLTVLALSCWLSAATQADARDVDAGRIGDILGTAATVMPDGVVRAGWVRDDVAVAVDGTELPPPAGLGSWAAFTAAPDGSVTVMGDTVVFEDEITPALDAALAHGLTITALHNHFTYERPPVYFMHIGGRAGNAAALAAGVRAMWDAIRDVRADRPAPAGQSGAPSPAVTGDYDIAALEAILGAEAAENGPVIKFTFGREAAMGAARIGASMGLSTWAAFSGNDAHAVVDGDFAMTADEVDPVIRALRAAGIHVVALHNHMIGEAPPYYFLHYWGNGDPAVLAAGIRAALDRQGE